MTDEQLEKIHDYRNTFVKNPSGKKVLIDLMKQGYFLNHGGLEVTVDMPEAVGKRSLINYIFQMLGCADDSDKNFEAVIESIGKLPIISKKPKKEEEV